MSREDLELEKLIETVWCSEMGKLSTNSERFSKLATAIMTWHKQREVELLEGLIDPKNLSCIGSMGAWKNWLDPDKIQNLITERMVGK